MDDGLTHICENNLGTVHWRKEDNFSGPDYSGFCLGLYGPDVTYVNVDYCPFCGKQLEKILDYQILEFSFCSDMTSSTASADLIGSCIIGTYERGLIHSFFQNNCPEGLDPISTEIINAFHLKTLPNIINIVPGETLPEVVDQLIETFRGSSLYISKVYDPSIWIVNPGEVSVKHLLFTLLVNRATQSSF